MRRLQNIGRGGRVLVFASIMIGGLMGLLALTLLLITFSFNSGDRVMAVMLADGVIVAELATLPDDDAYPAAVAVDAAGTVYTGSRATGAIWAITPSADGGATVSEVPGTREAVGAVNGLDVAPDGSLLILDRVSSDPRAGGGMIWRRAPDGTLAEFGTIDDANGFVSPGDIAVDALGRVYATDRGRGLVWAWDADGANGRLWWLSPAPEGATPSGEGDETPLATPTGLAYEPATNSLLVTDSEQNTIHRVPITPEGGAGEAALVYRHDPAQAATAPSFTGIAVAPDGAIYAAALGQNGLVQVDAGRITYIAGNFRGINDVTAGADGALYAANFDSRGLVVPLIRPQLPFGIDIIRREANP
jgi:sugar lactone lactonase YvrE